MTRLNESESILVLDSLRKYRGIIHFTDTPRQLVQQIDQLVDKLQSYAVDTPTEYLKKHCDNCE